MFSQIEVDMYYQEKLLKEQQKKKRSQLFPKQYMGESKFREDWYHQKNIIYPKQTILDKIKSKQELYQFRQNSENLKHMKSSIHGSSRKVNLEVYFDKHELLSGSIDPRFILRGSGNNSPDKSERYSQNSQKQYPSSPNGGIVLPPINQGNGMDLNMQTPSKYSKNTQMMKHHSQPHFQSQYQQYQKNSSQQYQQTSPTNKSQQSLFLTKQQQQQSDSKLNYDSRNQLTSDVSQLNQDDHPPNDMSAFDYQQSQMRSRVDSYQSSALTPNNIHVPQIQINNIRDNSTPNPRTNGGGKSNFSQEYSQNLGQDSFGLTPTPMVGDQTFTRRKQQQNFTKLMEGQEDGASQSQISNNNQSNPSQKNSKGGKGKNQPQEINISSLSPVEKFDLLMTKQNDTQDKFVNMVEQNNELSMIFENLSSLKLVDIAKILTKFFRYCMEKLIFGQTTKSSNKNSLQYKSTTKGIGIIDPRIFKKITLSQGLVKPLENFFASELEIVELHKEIAKFRLIWKELCEKHLLVHNLLLEIGGIRRLKVILQNIADSLQKHYTMKFSPSQIEDIFNFAQAIFQDNQSITSSMLLKYRQQLLKNRGTLNFQRVNFVDLFIIKHFVFLELSKEEYIPWESKLVLLQKLEAFRFENFRDLYNLPEQSEIVSHLKNFIPQALLDTLPYTSQDALNTFLYSLSENILGSGNTLKFIETMNTDGVPATYNNIIMMEHLVKSSIATNKDTPQIIRKIIEHKFVTMKRNLKINTNFNSIIIKADDIVNKMNTMNLILLKYLQIPAEEHKKYLDMNLFYQVLVESCSQLDAFSIQDLQYGMKFYDFTQKHYYFWVKSIKRVLLEMKYSFGDVQNLAIHLEKLFGDSTL